jgi:hypothetical protein
MKQYKIIAAIVWIFIFFIVPLQLKAQDDAKPVAGIKWTTTTIDFGKIEQGKPVSAEFEFSNPTMVPLIINAVRPTCGCTIANYPKEPIEPGKSSKIAVTYNAASSGYFSKTIVVTTNATEGNTSLIIKGEVIAKK